MKVLLLQDVYKLGRAGDVKKVANGYGRNYLIPQGLAVLATPGAMEQSEWIRTRADERRDALNQEMSGVAGRLEGQTLVFPVRASETGRLYGSVTTRMIADAANAKFNAEISHRQVETQPIRNLGNYSIPIRLTIDLAPELNIIVHREGEAFEQLSDEESEGAQASEDVDVSAEESQPAAKIEAESSQGEVEAQIEAEAK